MLFLLALSGPLRAASFTYYRDPHIHNMGNFNPVHAAIVPLSTWVIDRFAYNSVDVRANLLAHLRSDPLITSVADFGCGVGYSTAHTWMFTNAVGVDVSPQMVGVARRLHPHKRFAIGNIETFGETDSFDAVTLCYVLHEVPQPYREAIVANALRVARRCVVVMDIASSYTPRTDLFFSGEPYAENYLACIDRDLVLFNKATVISDHVDMWTSQVSHSSGKST